MNSQMTFPNIDSPAKRPPQRTWMKALFLGLFTMYATLSAAITVGTVLPQGAVGQPYLTTLTASGGVAPYTHVVSGVGLPPGLTLTTNGVLSGMPLAAGQFNFDVQSTDASNATGLTSLTLRIAGSTGLIISTTSLPPGRLGTLYDFTVAAQGGTAPYSFDLLLGGGQLPLGLALTSAGRITGTPTTGGVFPFSVRATDSTGASFQASYTLRIEAATLTISTASLAGASSNLPYSQTIVAIGGAPPYSFDLLAGSLPPGIALSPAGLLSGTPTNSGTYNFFLRVTDSGGLTAQASYSIAVAGSGLRLVTSALPTGIVNQTYSGALLAQGGNAPYTFTVLNGNLPPGLTLNSTGSISGTPSAAGVFPVTIRLSDSAGLSTQSNLLVNINSGLFNITNVVFPDGFVNTPYVLNLLTSGGTATVAYTLLSGSLPPGLSLSSNGSISGTPLATGIYPFAVRVIDSAGATAQLPITIKIDSSTLIISQAGLANGQLGQPYSSTLSAANAAPPFSFSFIGGSLPPGLILASNGNLSGTPTATGLFQAIFRVTDSRSATATATVPVFIGAQGLSISTLTLPSARQNQPYAAILQATRGTAPYTFEAFGSGLPTGLTLSPSGLLSGTPTQPPGSALFTVRVSDALNNVSFVTYSFNINTSNLLLTSTAPVSGQLGVAYNSASASSGGSGTTTYSLAAGALPPGLTLNPNGTISGTPLAPGTYTYTLLLTDGVNSTALFSQVLTVASSQLGFSATQLPDLLLGAQYLATLTGQGGTPPYTFSIAGGFLPPGIALSPNGTLSGVPVSQGVFSINFRITDGAGATATLSTALNVVSSTSLTITNIALPSGRRGSSYSAVLIGSGGTAPYRFALAPGSALPAGLTLSSAGFLSGTPTAEAESSFTVLIQDTTGLSVQRTFSLSVTNTVLNVTGELPSGRLGSSYSVMILPGGGVAPFTFSLVSGTLPPGLSLSAAGLISGTPSSAGSYPLVVRVRDASGDQIQRAFTLQIGVSNLSFASLTLPGLFVGQPYRAVLQAIGAVSPVSYSLASGTLPAGLTLSSTGVISGVPSASGQSSAAIQVTDGTGATALNTFVFGSVQSRIGFGFTALPNAFVSQPVNFTLTGTGGTGPYIFTSPTGLPLGLLLNSAGVLSGIPVQEGTFNVFVRATDAAGEVVEASFPLIVAAGGFRFTAQALPIAFVNQAYAQTLSTAGGTGSISFSLQSGNLPNGLTLAPTGSISGTPTSAGAFTFTVRAVDSANVTIATVLTLNVTSATVSFSTSTLPSGTVNQSYNQPLTAAGGSAPYTFMVVTGALPAGLTLSSTGILSGTPTSAGTSVFSVRVTDSLGQASTSEFLVGIGTVGSPGVLAVVSAANYSGNGVAPGEIVLLYGTGLGPVTLQSFGLTNGMVGTTLGGTRVLFDNVPAPIIYTSTNQVAVVAPFNLAGKTSVRVVVEQNGVASAVLLIPVRASRPAIFTSDASGNGPGAILNQDSTVNTSANPADRLSVVSLYLTGLGQTNPASVDGQVVNTIANLVTPVTVTINGLNAEVLYGGNAPGLVPGVAQLNVRIPSGALSGANVIRVTSGTGTSTGSVTVFVR